MSAPAGYPLPWCAALDRPWWRVNSDLIGVLPGWREWQAPRPMAVVIPVMRWLLDSGLAARLMAGLEAAA